MDYHEIRQIYDFRPGCWRYQRRRTGCMAGRPRPTAGPLLAAELAWRIYVGELIRPTHGCPTAAEAEVLVSLEQHIGADLMGAPEVHQAARYLAESLASQKQRQREGAR